MHRCDCTGSSCNHTMPPLRTARRSEPPVSWPLRLAVSQSKSRVTLQRHERRIGPPCRVPSRNPAGFPKPNTLCGRSSTAVSRKRPLHTTAAAIAQSENVEREIVDGGVGREPKNRRRSRRRPPPGIQAAFSRLLFGCETAGRFMARRLPFEVSRAKTRAGPRAGARLRAAPPLRAARSAPPASQLGPLAAASRAELGPGRCGLLSPVHPPLPGGAVHYRGGDCRLRLPQLPSRSRGGTVPRGG